MRASFHHELEELEAAIQEEGALVLRVLRSALNALARGDDELADEVIRFDDEIDRRYIRIEEGVQSLLARQTPVASDLRLVLAVLRVNLHLERMADYCVTVAKLTKLAADGESDPKIVANLAEMGVRAEEMTRVALRSFEPVRSLPSHDRGESSHGPCPRRRGSVGPRRGRSGQRECQSRGTSSG